MVDGADGLEVVPDAHSRSRISRRLKPMSQSGIHASGPVHDTSVVHVLGHIGHPPGRGPGRPPQPLEGGLRVQMLAADDYAFGLLDQPPVLQGGLELVGQPALGRGGRTRRLQKDLACSRRCLVGPDGSRRTQSGRLDDQRDDQGPSDTRSDGKASCFLDGSKSRLGGLPHGGSRVRPSSTPMGLGVGAQTSPGGPGESGRGGLLWSLAQQ